MKTNNPWKVRVNKQILGIDGTTIPIKESSTIQLETIDKFAT